jgi:hypothetical protein
MLFADDVTRKKRTQTSQTKHETITAMISIAYRSVQWGDQVIPTVRDIVPHLLWNLNVELCCSHHYSFLYASKNIEVQVTIINKIL